jgi:hypothetical protein
MFETDEEILEKNGKDPEAVRAKLRRLRDVEGFI